jgi:hypothetical protein
MIRRYCVTARKDGARTSPPGAPVPLIATRRLADMPFRRGGSAAASSVISNLRAVAFLTGRICDLSNGERQQCRIIGLMLKHTHFSVVNQYDTIGPWPNRCATVHAGSAGWIVASRRFSYPCRGMRPRTGNQPQQMVLKAWSRAPMRRRSLPRPYAPHRQRQRFRVIRIRRVRRTETGYHTHRRFSWALSRSGCRMRCKPL